MSARTIKHVASQRNDDSLIRTPTQEAAR